MSDFDDVNSPDPPLNPEQEAVAASLSPEMVERIDTALLSHAKTRWRKVAMLVGSATSDPAVRVPGLPDLCYARRVKVLVERGLLVVEGNFEFMGRTEVRLP